MNHLKLFSPYQLGSITLQNRVIMAPMTRSRAIDNIPSTLIARYYEQRSGAGLIVTEGTSPSPNGLGYCRIPGIFSHQQVEAWKVVTHAVHQKGSHIFLQMMHTGRVSHILNLPEGAEVIAPSPVAVPSEMYTDAKGMQPFEAPREMAIADIHSTIQEYIQGAKNAIEAGFDGVEIHGANGYLVEQFIHPKTNFRADEYGGSIENRSRFALEIASGIANAIGKERTGIRLSPYGMANHTGVFDGVEETHLYLAEQLGKIGLVYLHLVDHSSMGAHHIPETFKKQLKSAFGGTFILSGGYDKTRAENDLNSGLGDLVAFGKPFISNPDLVKRFIEDKALSNFDNATFYSPGAKGYIDYQNAS